jgi:hypothetical protein
VMVALALIELGMKYEDAVDFIRQWVLQPVHLMYWYDTRMARYSSWQNKRRFCSDSGVWHSRLQDICTLFSCCIWIIRQWFVNQTCIHPQGKEWRGDLDWGSAILDHWFSDKVQTHTNLQLFSLFQENRQF